MRNTEAEDVINGREYIKRLRRQYEQLHPAPRWAKGNANARGQSNGRLGRRSSGGSGSGDSEDNNAGGEINDSDSALIPQPASTRALADLLRNAGALVQPPTSAQQRSFRVLKLRPEIINIERLKDVTARGPSSVDSLHFHPKYPLLLFSGPSSTVSVHHISPDHQPQPHPLLTSVHVKDTPLHSTAFHCPKKSDGDTNDDATTIYLSSRRRYIHSWSLSSGRISKISRPLNSNPHLRTTQRSTETFRLSPCGRYIGFVGSARKGGGHINVFSVSAGMQWMSSCRVDSRDGVADFAWWSDGNGFVVAGKNGECSEYDIRERRVVNRWVDDGAVGTTVIALGGGRDATGDDRKPKRNSKKSKQRLPLGGDRWVAIGSSSGIVNIYDRSRWFSTPQPDSSTVDDEPLSETRQISASNAASAVFSPPPFPTPTRTLTQLTTSITSLFITSNIFNGSELLIMASRHKKGALRLVHLPSCTVYRNWPTQQTPLGRVASVASSKVVFGKDGGKYNSVGSSMLLAIGNDQGAVRLWEIRGQ